MEYHWTEPFRKDFRALPARVQSSFAKALRKFEANERHPSLGIKKMEGQSEIWELRVTRTHRMTFTRVKGGVFLRRIGTHDILRTP